jgi:hypothetical protein
VALIDDDEWVRRGRAVALEGCPEVELALVVSTGEVLGRGGSGEEMVWEGIDAVVVDPYLGPARFDRYGGVAAVEQIRASDGGEAPGIVAVSERVGDPYLRARLAWAGADYAYCRFEVGDVGSLLNVIAFPDGQHRLPSGDHVLYLPGVRAGGRPGELLRLLEEEGVGHAFTPGLAQLDSGLSRRTIIRLRKLAAEVGGIETAPHRRCGGPADLGALPTWREVVDQVNRLRGAAPGEVGQEVIVLP